MSDLNDFFAKKDRRRKKATKGGKPSHSADWNSPATESASVSDNAASDSVNSSGNIQAPSTKPSKSDDGWIEIDDPKTARVNTGGKTVEEFRRDYDDKEQNGKEDAPAEKFTGWAVATESAEGTETLTEVAKSPAAAFPSLADAASAPEVPVARNNPVEGSSSAAPSRPRFTNSKLAAGLKKMLEDNTSTGLPNASNR